MGATGHVQSPDEVGAFVDEMQRAIMLRFGAANGSDATIVDPKDMKQVRTVEASDSSLTVVLIAAQYLYIPSNQTVPENTANGSGLVVANDNNAK
jgi:hypothetical protein